MFVMSNMFCATAQPLESQKCIFSRLAADAPIDRTPAPRISSTLDARVKITFSSEARAATQLQT